MKNRWLTFVVVLTNKIYRNKQVLGNQHGGALIKSVIVLVFFEFALLIISLPLYVTLSLTTVAAFLEEKGEYENIVVDYKLRRVITVTGLSIVLLAWALKLIFILSAPYVVDTPQLYTVSIPDETTAVEVLEHREEESTGSLQTAILDQTLSIPTIDSVEGKRGVYTFSGIGEPEQAVTVFKDKIQFLNLILWLILTHITKQGCKCHSPIHLITQR